MQSVYSAYEGTALRQCKEYNSDFSWVNFYATLASAVGPLLASITIQDAVEVGEENNYTLAFYIFDGFLFLALLISFKLKVNLGTSELDQESKIERKKENRRALKDLVNPSALIFFGILFGGGAMWGVHDTYLLIYLQNDLGASSQFIGQVSHRK